MSQYKKSKLYERAQCAVLEASNLTTPTKLEILHILFEDEKLALFEEEREDQLETEVQG